MDMKTEACCLELDLGRQPKEKGLTSFPQSKAYYGPPISEELPAHFYEVSPNPESA